jgi:hypothetical protein
LLRLRRELPPSRWRAPPPSEREAIRLPLQGALSPAGGTRESILSQRFGADSSFSKEPYRLRAGRGSQSSVSALALTAPSPRSLSPAGETRESILSQRFGADSSFSKEPYRLRAGRGSPSSVGLRADSDRRECPKGTPSPRSLSVAGGTGDERSSFVSACALPPSPRGKVNPSDSFGATSPFRGGNAG